MPNVHAPGVRPHSFTCHDELWAQVVARAAADDVSVSALVRAALITAIRPVDAEPPAS